MQQGLLQRGSRGHAAVAGCACAGLLAAWSAPAGATLLVYESFDYATGVVAGATATGQNLTGTYTGSPVPPGFELQVASPGLDYGSLVGVPPVAGNRLSQALGTTAASATVQIDSDVGVAPGTAVYFSALFTLDDSANGNHFASITLTDPDNGDSLAFGEAVVGVRALRISATTVATGSQLVADSAGEAFTNGQRLFLVGRYTNGAAALADSLEVVAYDTAASISLPSAFDPSDPTAQIALALAGLDLDLAKIGSIDFTIRGSANNFIDELRIGTAYADVVPEPSTAPLLLVGLAGLGLRSARRRRR